MLSSNVAEAVAMIRTEPSLPAPDIELIFAPVAVSSTTASPSRPGHGLHRGGPILLQPRSTGTITLAGADPGGRTGDRPGPT